MIVKKTQEDKILDILRKFEWVSTEYFEQFMTTSSLHRAIWCLENKRGYKDKIEHSRERDNKGFIHYRLIKNPVQGQLFKTGVMIN